MVCWGGLAALGCSKPHAPDSVTGTELGSSADGVRDAEPPVSASAPPEKQHPDADRDADRERMVELHLRGRGIQDPRVLAAMSRVPRHRFVPEATRAMAYADRPLPIGHGQTISQPYIVALMTEQAQPRATDRCLEIGTGSGYQAAVLAELCQRVYSIEYLAPVAEGGERNLRAAGYGADKVELRVGDGYRGWPEAAPFDVILVTAAPEQVPQPLLDQLAVGGRLVIPVGGQASAQELQRWTRRRAGGGQEAFQLEELMPVRFVPFLGSEAKSP